MARGLRQIIVAGVPDPASRSIVDEVLAQTRDTDVPLNHVEKRLREHLAAKSADSEKFRQVQRAQRNNRDVNGMTDDQKNLYAVWISDQNDMAAERSDESSNAVHIDSSVGQKFRGCSHHYFCNGWGTVGTVGIRDEEWWIPHPEPMLPENPRYLCEMCRHINFEVLFTTRNVTGNQLPDIPRIQLHGLHRMVTQHQCAFCRFITQRMQSEKIIDMLDTNCLRQTEIFINVLDEGSGCSLRLEVELSNDSTLWKTQRYILQRLIADEKQPFSALHVDQAKADLSALRRWLKACTSTHAQPTHLRSEMSALRVIDVVEMKICMIDIAMPYACLSYVWGNTEQTKNTVNTRHVLQQTGGLSNPSLQLPMTVLDAITVSRQLNVRYLWVDSLCIEQDNVVDKQILINNMASVYTRAILTLVASTNSTPSDGLPGVTKPRSKKQVVARLGLVDVAMVFHDARKPLTDIQESIWNSRGWTYQEQVLSSRMVYFTDAQLVFICENGCIFEDTVPPPEHRSQYFPQPSDEDPLNFPELHSAVIFDPEQATHVNKAFKTKSGQVTYVCEEKNDQSSIQSTLYEYKRVLSPNFNSQLERSLKGSFWNAYLRHATNFSQRKLTHSEDIILAFTGLTEHITGGTKVQFWYNIPSTSIERALLWYHPSPTSRRQGTCPSWSWAGWHGEIKYRGKGWHNAINFAPVTAVQWFQPSSIQKILKEHGDDLGQEGRDKIQILRREFPLHPIIESVDPFELYQFGKLEDKGWKLVNDFRKNEQTYTNDLHPEVSFDCPVPPPDQQIITLPDTSGTLFFKAFAVSAKFCDMSPRSHVKKAGQESYLQIGLNDEERSANMRKPWQRIIYHQGYRVGFLTLDIPMQEIDLTSDLYEVVALSRDSRPSIQTPTWHEAMRKFEMNMTQYMIGYRQYYKDELEIPLPDETAEPNYEPNIESGDPHWDTSRFRNSGEMFPIYNVLFVKPDEDRLTRLGIGKMHFHALHHAGAQRKMIKLR